MSEVLLKDFNKNTKYERNYIVAIKYNSKKEKGRRYRNICIGLFGKFVALLANIEIKLCDAFSESGRCYCL